MKYLLDTCAISETRRKAPNAGFKRWLAGVDRDDLYLSVLTIGELRSGACSDKNVARREILSFWVDEAAVAAFRGHIIALDLPAADRWGAMFGQGVAVGRKPPVVDSMIAATAIQHGMTVVTRNVSDFQSLGVQLLNPFT